MTGHASTSRVRCWFGHDFQATGRLGLPYRCSRCSKRPTWKQIKRLARVA